MTFIFAGMSFKTHN